jgi:hypothetical protein
MGERIMSLLRQGREEAVAELARTDRRALRPLTGRLWDPDAQIRRRAAGAIGRSAALSPELGRELIRRLLWALNDESATNGVYGIPALGEIGHRCPGVLAPFVPILVTMARDDGLRVELLSALDRVAKAAPGLVRPHVTALEGLVDASRRDEAQALRKLMATVGEETGETD